MVRGISSEVGTFYGIARIYKYGNADCGQWQCIATAARIQLVTVNGRLRATLILRKTAV